MAKFTSPLGKELWITQTYHTGGNNTAIDLSANADVPVYALADGIVTYRSSGAGSYCIQTVSDSTLKIYYVHTYKWVGANTFVKKGDVICYIAPTSLNGGYPTHLHLGLQTGKEIMDYFDRSIVFRTKYQAIKDIWFKGEDLDWSKFRDLSYIGFKIGDKIQITGEQNIRQGSGTSYAITGDTEIGEIYEIEDGPRTSDGYDWYDLKNNNWVADVGKFQIFTQEETPVDCQKEIDRLLEVNRGLSVALGASEDLLKTRDGELSEARGTIKLLEANLEEAKNDYANMEENYTKVLEAKERIEQEKLVAQEELDILRQKTASWEYRLADILHGFFNKN